MMALNVTATIEAFVAAAHATREKKPADIHGFFNLPVGRQRVFLMLFSNAGCPNSTRVAFDLWK